jgi:uncharacterized protein YjbI with pentapeptide repeats
VDSSVVGYDGARNVRDEERSVGQRKPEREQKEELEQSRWGFRGMTVRDWLQLLIVPLALVVIGFLFTMQQDARQQQIEDQRAEAERELAVQRAQDEALQAYLDQMSSLLLEKDLRESKEDSEVRMLARARTLTVLKRLDSERNSDILQFLREAQLISRTDPVISLNRSNLSGAKLSGVDLSEADLRRDQEASRANFNNADLSGANLSDAYLAEAYLIGANLSDADLLNTNLRGASLGLADLHNATLSKANLLKADLSGANLSEVKGPTSAQLEGQARSLERATMPNGQKYEDWLKDRDKRQQDE